MPRFKIRYSILQFFQLIPYYDKFIEESKESHCRESCKDIEWQYPCVLTSYRHSCRMHDQCRILWKRCDRILELVFAFDTNKLRLDFKKVGINLYPIIRSMKIPLQLVSRRPCTDTYHFYCIDTS